MDQLQWHGVIDSHIVYVIAASDLLDVFVALFG